MSSERSAATSQPVDAVAERLSLAGVRSVVVKLGTQLLSRGGGDRTLDTDFIAAIAGQIAGLRQKKIRVTVVSSGAVGAGMARLGLQKRPDDLATLQAVAAVGQPRLMTAWSEALAPHGLSAAQILLTREDIDDRTRFLNLRNTLAAAEELGAVPVINENDTVSTDEMVRISFGDNDLLAALVTQAIGAELLVLLTVVDGVLDAAGSSVRIVRSISQAQALVRKEKSAAGKGGMDSKVKAAEIVTHGGERLVVANGRTPNVLPRLLSGEEIGTLFLSARAKRKTGRSRWIASARPAGGVSVDAGAVKALRKGGSLLPAGVSSVTGEFQPGDVIEITDATGELIAKGLSNYSHGQVSTIMGRRSADIKSLFADASYDEVVHRDNMILMRSEDTGKA